MLGTQRALTAGVAPLHAQLPVTAGGDIANGAPSSRAPLGAGEVPARHAGGGTLSKWAPWWRLEHLPEGSMQTRDTHTEWAFPSGKWKEWECSLSGLLGRQALSTPAQLPVPLGSPPAQSHLLSCHTEPGDSNTHDNQETFPGAPRQLLGRKPVLILNPPQSCRPAGGGVG